MGSSDLLRGYIHGTQSHIYLTGKAGTGKTSLLKELKKSSFKSLAVVAPTGIAAMNAEGSTIHSFFQLPPGIFPPVYRYRGNLDLPTEVYDRQTLFRKLRLSRAKLKLIGELELLIIDEVSMLRCDLLDAIHAVLQRFRKSRELFGGVQVLFIGDLYQLPPVVPERERLILQEYYSTPFFIGAKSLQNHPLKVIRLEKVYRQTDKRFAALLNRVRMGTMTEDDKKILSEKEKTGYRPKIDSGVVTLTTHRYKAKQINQISLAKLSGNKVEFHAKIKGSFPKSLHPVPETLEIKREAQVMFTVNSGNGKYYNGLIGKVMEINEHQVLVKVEGKDKPVKVEPYTWENSRNIYNHDMNRIELDSIGSFRQFPLKLAWAITIHKSQGLSFQKAVIDPEKCFESGQLYVALSRLKSLDGLVLSSPLPEIEFQNPNSGNIFRFGHEDSQALKKELIRLSCRFYRKELNTESLHLSISRLYHRIEAFFIKFTDDDKDSSAFKEHFKRIKGEIAYLQDRLGAIFSNAISDPEIHYGSSLIDQSEYEHFFRALSKLQSAISTFNGIIGLEYFEEMIEQAEIESMYKDLLNVSYLFKRKLDVIALCSRLETRELEDSKIKTPKFEAAEKQVRKLQRRLEKYHSKRQNKAPDELYRKCGKSEFESLELLKKGLSISEICDIRGLKRNTIKNHIKRLLFQNKIDLKDYIEDELLQFLEIHLTSFYDQPKKKIREELVRILGRSKADLYLIANSIGIDFQI